MRCIDLGRTRYQPVFQAMQNFTVNRTAETPDELWFTEHEPVFTQGQAGRAEHLLAPGDIEVVQSDRGGQVTYHGPGQLVGYLMVDVRRARLTPRALVTAIETSIVGLLAEYGINGSQSRRCTRRLRRRRQSGVVGAADQTWMLVSRPCAQRADGSRAVWPHQSVWTAQPRRHPTCRFRRTVLRRSRQSAACAAVDRTTLRGVMNRAGRIAA